MEDGLQFFSMNNFSLIALSKKSRARAGILSTAHGSILTPAFMPIATQGAVKSLTIEEVKSLGAGIVLSNTYHQYLQPGIKVIKKFGGLHAFMKCDLPLLTDSGGFQIFSLANMVKVKRHGVEFLSHINGDRHFLTPRKSIDIQAALGSDIMMVLDLFPGFPASRQQAEHSVTTTTRWAKECLEHKQKLEARSFAHRAIGLWPKKRGRQLLFAIVQGSTYKDLRRRSAKELTAFDFDGFAVG